MPSEGNLARADSIVRAFYLFLQSIGLVLLEPAVSELSIERIGTETEGRCSSNQLKQCFDPGNQ